jgi:hypothetical protein
MYLPITTALSIPHQPLLSHINPHYPLSTLVIPHQPLLSPINPRYPLSTLVIPHRPSSFHISPHYACLNFRPVIGSANIRMIFNDSETLLAVNKYVLVKEASICCNFCCGSKLTLAFVAIKRLTEQLQNSIEWKLIYLLFLDYFWTFFRELENDLSRRLEDWDSHQVRIKNNRHSGILLPKKRELQSLREYLVSILLCSYLFIDILCVVSVPWWRFSKIQHEI